jgi:sulfur carrier protein
MKLTINGEPQVSSAETLGALIETLGMKPDRVAIELNREIVPRDQWPQTPLHDGDRLEIVQFVGGGTGLCRNPDGRKKVDRAIPPAAKRRHRKARYQPRSGDTGKPGTSREAAGKTGTSREAATQESPARQCR